MRTMSIETSRVVFFFYDKNLRSQITSMIFLVRRENTRNFSSAMARHCRPEDKLLARRDFQQECTLFLTPYVHILVLPRLIGKVTI